MKTLCLIMGALVLPCAAGYAAPATTAAKPSPAMARQTALQSWPAESLSGKVTMVEPQKDLLVVRDSTGTPFDLVITHATRITSGGQRENLSEVPANQPVSIRFIPEARGDIAERIVIGG